MQTEVGSTSIHLLENIVENLLKLILWGCQTFLLKTVLILVLGFRIKIGNLIILFLVLLNY